MYGTLTAALVVIAVAQLYVAVSPCHRATVHDSAVAALLMAELVLLLLTINTVLYARKSTNISPVVS
jgi:hypothetical protein